MIDSQWDGCIASAIVQFGLFPAISSIYRGHSGVPWTTIQPQVYRPQLQSTHWWVSLFVVDTMEHSQGVFSRLRTLNRLKSLNEAPANSFILCCISSVFTIPFVIDSQWDGCIASAIVQFGPFPAIFSIHRIHSRIPWTTVQPRVTGPLGKSTQGWVSLWIVLWNTFQGYQFAGSVFSIKDPQSSQILKRGSCEQLHSLLY